MDTGPLTPRMVLANYVDGYPRQYLAAEALGVSPPYLNQMLSGYRRINDRVLKLIGYQRVVTCKPIETKEE